MSLPEHLSTELSAALANLKAYVLWLQRSGCFAGAGMTEHGPAPLPERATLQAVRAALGECTRCKLHQGRRTIVFGEGNPHAALVFVGEAPGADEDEQGRPFVGKAGQLLTRIIQAIGLQRSDVYIANILKCRPPGNRDPEDDEISTCIPFLRGQLAAIRPRVICALGRFAARALLDTDQGITHLRGRFHRFGDILVMPTYHPSYLLRNESKKRETWIDMQMVQKELMKDET